MTDYTPAEGRSLGAQLLLTTVVLSGSKIYRRYFGVIIWKALLIACDLMNIQIWFS